MVFLLYFSPVRRKSSFPLCLCCQCFLVICWPSSMLQSPLCIFPIPKDRQSHPRRSDSESPSSTSPDDTTLAFRYNTTTVDGHGLQVDSSQMLLSYLLILLLSCSTCMVLPIPAVSQHQPGEIG